MACKGPFNHCHGWIWERRLLAPILVALNSSLVVTCSLGVTLITVVCGISFCLHQCSVTGGADVMCTQGGR